MVGVQREDLLEALNGELNPLKQCWGVNLTGDGKLDHESLLRAVKYVVSTNLKVHISRLKPPRAVSKRLYLHVVSVSFNILIDEGHAELAETDLTARRQWLEVSMPANLRVSARTSRRYLNHALDQIEQQILEAGYTPVEYRPEDSASDQLQSLVIPSVIEPVPSDVAESRGGVLPRDVSIENNPKSPTRRRRSTLHKRVWQFGIPASVIILAVAIGVPLILSRYSQRAPIPVPALNVSVQQVRDRLDGWHATFDRAHQAQATPFLAEAIDGHNVPSNFDAFLKGELNAGAYLADGALFQIEVDSPSNRSVTITNVKPVDVTTLPIADGPTLFLYTQGDVDNLNMAFDMDDASPVAKDYNLTTASVGGPYFSSKHIRIAAGSSDVLGIIIDVLRSAKAFRLEIDYSVGGEQGKQVVSLDGKPNGTPFRVTADSCPGAGQHMAAADLRRLRDIRYSTVRLMTIVPNNENYVWKSIAPDVYAKCDL
ncbi:MAG TPA: hypothetical protein VFW65_33130 [Pseudonocardiaceae bacterium]|nr:hypothetical protein [Pseudonocardiaceae bacterium]